MSGSNIPTCSSRQGSKHHPRKEVERQKVEYNAYVTRVWGESTARDDLLHVALIVIIKVHALNKRLQSLANALLYLYCLQLYV
jgi:hypothetical protein